MARILGVIAEYNPFHAGHAYHLHEARSRSQADFVVVVMSTCFTQRGDAAILSPSDRVRMALTCGADAVFALPAVWAVRDAEHFALGGTAILTDLGCDAISFGSETEDNTTLQAAAQLLERQDDAFQQELQSHLSSGLPYPAALAAAAEAVNPGTGQVLSQPNSTLAVCYLRALLRLGASAEVFPVPRCGAYHATALQHNSPSATALRGAILRGDWQSVRTAMPGNACSILLDAASNGRLHRPEALDAALLYRLRTMTREDYAALPDVSEGIEFRLQAAAAAARTRDELLTEAKTRRYPHSRLSRLATHALLGLTDELFRSLSRPNAAWLLGFRKGSEELISHLSRRSRLPIISRSSGLDPHIPWINAELRAQDIWALGAGMSSGLARSQAMVIVP